MKSSAGQQRIKADFVNDYAIKLPSFEEQNKVITKLKQKEKDKRFLFDFIGRQGREKTECLNNL